MGFLEKPMVKINVVLYATLAKYHPRGEGTKEFILEVPKCTTLAELLNILKVPQEESKQIFVDSLRREPDYQLQNGERAAIFPPIAGG